MDCVLAAAADDDAGGLVEDLSASPPKSPFSSGLVDMRIRFCIRLAIPLGSESAGTGLVWKDVRNKSF